LFLTTVPTVLKNTAAKAETPAPPIKAECERCGGRGYISANGDAAAITRCLGSVRPALEAGTITLCSCHDGQFWLRMIALRNPSAGQSAPAEAAT
jgi:hypothetical protein